MEGDYQDMDYPGFDEHDDMHDADEYEEEMEEEDEHMDQEDLEFGEECVPEKAENVSTYESISDIKMDKPSMKSAKTAATAEGKIAVEPQLPGADNKGGANSEACTSADISSMSYNTVPEEPFPDIEIGGTNGVSTNLNGTMEMEDEDQDTDNDSDDIKEDEPAEAYQTSLTSRGGRASSSRPSSRMTKKKSRVSKSATCRKSKTYTNKKDKTKQKVRQINGSKPVAKRDLITPAAETNFDPDAPKRPLTAFKLFMNEFRSKYSEKYPNISFAEMTDIGAEVWRDMSSQKKTEFQNEAQRRQDQYLNEMKEYQSKKQLEKSAKPKTAYQIFMSDYLNKEYEKRKNLKTQSRLTKQDLFMRGVRKWNRMTRNQKVIYEAQSRMTKHSHYSDSCPQTSAPSTSTPSTLSAPSTPSLMSSSYQPSTSAKTVSSRERYTTPLPEPTPPKKNRKIEFSEEDEVAQFRDDDTIETWYQASKGF